MRGDLRDVAEFRGDGEILLLGRPGAFADLPRGLGERLGAETLMRRLAGREDAMLDLRRFWSRQRSSFSLANLSDHALLDLVDAAVRRRELQAVVLQQIHWLAPPLASGLR
jgi:hypothetical protein